MHGAYPANAVLGMPKANKAMETVSRGIEWATEFVKLPTSSARGCAKHLACTAHRMAVANGLINA